jgi:hypothetical protein
MEKHPVQLHSDIGRSPFTQVGSNHSTFVEKRQGSYLIRIQGTSIFLCDAAQHGKIAILYPFRLYKDNINSCAWGTPIGNRPARFEFGSFEGMFRGSRWQPHFHHWAIASVCPGAILDMWPIIVRAVGGWTPHASPLPKFQCASTCKTLVTKSYTN